MAMIKCKECEKEMSDHAKICPHCGYENSIMFCPECDKQLSSKANMCPHCGYAFKNINNGSDSSKGENYNMALASLICSFFGITSIVSLVLGIIVLNANKGKTNSAKTMATISVIISGVVLFVGFLWIIIYSTY